MIRSSEQIRVAHLLFGDGVWGVENYVYNLLGSSRASSIKPLIVCTSQGSISQKFSDTDVDMNFVPVRGYADFSSMGELAKFFETHHVDIVHVHLGLDSFVGTIAAKLAHLPVIMSVHFDQPNYMSYGAMARRSWNALQILKNKSIAHFLPITQNVANELMSREAVAAEKVTVVHPGIPVFEIDRDCRDQIRTDLGAAADDVVVVGVGRLVPEKNFDCLVDAFSKIQKKQKIKLWIVGDGAQRPEIEAMIERLQLQDNIKMLGYRNDVKKLLASADMFVLPSKAEPFGMAAVEAMMSELPVIGTIGPGLSTIVDSNVTGLLVPPDDPDELAKAIEKLAEDSNLRRSLGLAGKERAIATFSSDGMAEKIVAIYHDILTQTSKKN